MYTEIETNNKPIPVVFKRNWVNYNSVTFVVEWLATAVMIIAAVGIVQKWPSTIWILNAGSVLWLLTAYLKRQWSLFAVNFVLLGVYIYGLFV
jgi:hypothetical protein